MQRFQIYKEPYGYHTVRYIVKPKTYKSMYYGISFKVNEPTQPFSSVKYDVFWGSYAKSIYIVRFMLGYWMSAFQ